MLINPLSLANSLAGSFHPGSTKARAADSSTKTAGADSTGNTPSSDPTNGSSDLFLSLLVAQLKTQDPTSPMDPTQMVGQMLSMNQLNELIQIQQTLQNMATPPTTT